MKKTLSIVLPLIGLIAIVVAYYYAPPGTKASIENPQTAPLMPPDSDLREEVKVSAPPVSVMTLTAPKHLKGFKNWSAEERLDKVTELMNVKKLSPDTLNYMKLAIRDWTLDGTTRNNMANALCAQTIPDPQLYMLFMGIYHTPGETHEFKDFAVQFIGRSHSFADNPRLVRQTLNDIIRNEPTRIAGTAIIQLAYLEQMGELTIEPQTLDVMTERLVDDKQPIAVRMSVMGVIGKRQDRSHLALIRSLIKENEQSDNIRRVAIATLGQIGETADLEGIRAWLCHHNQLVVRAAEGAIRRLAPDQFATIIEDTYAEKSTVAKTLPTSLALPPMQTGDLRFDSLSKTLKAKGRGETVKATYTFKNSGSKTINIQSTQTSCGCTTAGLKKKIFKPGESGTLQVNLNTRGRQGTHTKSITLTTDEPSAKPYKLSITAEIPELLRCSPKRLDWKAGEEATRKCITLKAIKDTISVSPTRISLTNRQAFSSEIECIEKGRIYKVWITPTSTAKSTSTSFRVQTDYPKSYPLHFRCRAVVK